MAMKPIRQYRPATAEHAMHRPRDPRADRLHPAREILRRRRFDDQVHVVALDRVVRDTKAPAIAGDAHRPLERAHEATTPQRRDLAPHAPRDVAWMAGVEGRVGAVRIARVATGLAPGAVAATAPGRRRAEVEGELARGASSHDREDHTILWQIRSLAILNCAMFSKPRRADGASSVATNRCHDSSTNVRPALP